MGFESWLAMVPVLVAAGQNPASLSAGEGPQEACSAADLVRTVYAAEAWIRQVDSCLIRTDVRQHTPMGRESTDRPTAAELQQLRESGQWKQTQQSQHEIAWDRTRVRSTVHYADSGRWATAWDGSVVTVHEVSAERNRDNYGLYDDSRKHTQVSFVVNLWSYGGLVTDDRNTWWRTRDPKARRAREFRRPEDFRPAGKARVGERECCVVESLAGRLRLYIDSVDHRVRRMTHFGIPNDLDEALRVAAMRKAADVEVATSGDWSAWIATLEAEPRLAAKRRYNEALFPSARVSSEVYPSEYVEVVPGGWLPRRFTRISSYPDWDVVERTGNYSHYKVSRVDVEVTALRVNETLPEEALAIGVPEGGKVFDWRFDPPAEYEFRKDRTQDEIRAIAEEAKRQQDERLAPFRKSVAQIEKRLGQEAPELPQKTWFNGEPLELGGLRGRVIILHFWATWCGPCHNDIKTLVRLRKSRTSDPLVIGIHDSKAEASAVEKVIAERGMKYPICIDAKGEGASASQREWYRIRALPYAILIDEKGRVAAHGSLEDLLEKGSERR